MDKDKAIIVVLTQRAEVLRRMLDTTSEPAYYLGKLHGYEQAIDLLQSSLKSIQTEIV